MPIAVSPGEQVVVDLVIAKEGNAVRRVIAKVSRASRVTSRGGPPISGGVVVPGAIGPPPPRRPAGPGVVAGTITDADGKPVAGVEVRTMRWLTGGSAPVLASFSQSGRTDEVGRYRLEGRQPGQYLIVAAAFPIGAVETTDSLMPAPLVQPDGRRLAYVTTFFPGTRFAGRAIPVTIGAGETKGVDFRLDRVAVTDVTGSVSGPSALAALLVLLPANPGDQIHARRVRADVGGTFTFRDVPPGAYELSASAAGAWGRLPVEVSETTPPPPLQLTLQQPFVVKGRVEFRGREALPASSQLEQMDAFSVSIRPAVMAPGASIAGTVIMPGGEFSLGVRGPGRYILQARTTAPWVQVAGIINGQDTLDIPTEITGNISDALVVIADRLTSVLGQVADERGQPATGGTAIVFSEERQYWTSSRRVQVLAVLPGGTFTVSGLPPGRYRAIVRRDLRPDQPATRSLLESLFENATPFELSEGQHRTLPLTVAGGRQRSSF
jgi:hypothetical protein